MSHIESERSKIEEVALFLDRETHSSSLRFTFESFLQVSFLNFPLRKIVLDIVSVCNVNHCVDQEIA